MLSIHTPNSSDTSNVKCRRMMKKGFPKRSAKRKEKYCSNDDFFIVMISPQLMKNNCLNSKFSSQSSLLNPNSSSSILATIEDGSWNTPTVCSDSPEMMQLHHGHGSISSPSSMMNSTNITTTSHLITNRILGSSSRRMSTHTPTEGYKCTSCSLMITPYWRDGWNPEVMLCNACGLRYQKFARHCAKCNYIPRKEESMTSSCTKCGNLWNSGADR